MRKTDTMLKDYVQKLSLENLKFLNERLNGRLCGDLAETLDFLSKNTEMDRWLGSAKNGPDIFNMLDTAQEYIDREYYRRLPEYVG